MRVAADWRRRHVPAVAASGGRMRLSISRCAFDACEPGGSAAASCCVCPVGVPAGRCACICFSRPRRPAAYSRCAAGPPTRASAAAPPASPPLVDAPRALLPPPPPPPPPSRALRPPLLRAATAAAAAEAVGRQADATAPTRS